MAVTNGIGACVSLDAAGGTSFTEVSTTKGWRINHSAIQAISIPSNGGSGQIVTAGAKDFSGSFDFDGVDFPMYPGATGNLLAYNGDDSAQGLIICDSATINVDVSGGANVGGTVNFQGNGALTFGTASDTDATDPKVYNSIGGGRVDWKPNGQGSYATLPDVLNWSLTLGRTMSAPYASSTTPGYMKRTAGSYFGSGSITILQSALDYLDNTANDLQPGTAGRFLLYVNASEYFELWFARINALEFSATPDANSPVTIPFTLSLGEYVSSTWTPGKVIKPGGAATWFGSL